MLVLWLPLCQFRPLRPRLRLPIRRQRIRRSSWIWWHRKLRRPPQAGNRRASGRIKWREIWTLLSWNLDLWSFLRKHWNIGSRIIGRIHSLWLIIIRRSVRPIFLAWNRTRLNLRIVIWRIRWHPVLKKLLKTRWHKRHPSSRYLRYLEVWWQKARWYCWRNRNWRDTNASSTTSL